MDQATCDILEAANLAKLELTDAQIKEYAGQLAKVLAYVKELQSITEVAQVRDEEIGQITGLTNQLASDEVKGCGISREKLLVNAPLVEDGYIKVKSIFGRAT